MFLEISQNSQENTYARVSFLIKFLGTPFFTKHLGWLLLKKYCTWWANSWVYISQGNWIYPKHINLFPSIHLPPSYVLTYTILSKIWKKRLTKKIYMENALTEEILKGSWFRRWRKFYSFAGRQNLTKTIDFSLLWMRLFSVSFFRLTVTDLITGKISLLWKNIFFVNVWFCTFFHWNLKRWKPQKLRFKNF